MSDKIGGISLDDIISAAMNDLEDTTIQRNQEQFADNTISKEKSDQSQSLNIGGVSLDDIMKAASYDISPNENVEKDTVYISNDKKEDVERTNINIENTADTKDSQIQVIAQNDIVQTADSDIDQATNIDEDIKKVENKAKVIATLRKFYLFDMLYRTVKAKNWGLLIWIFLNFIIVEFFLVIGGPVGLIAGPVIYIVSLAIALSPIGEFALRQSNACRAIKDKKIEAKIKPIFDKVYAEAREKNPEISPKVQLFMCDEECENAFATGRRTVCITKGLAKMDEEHIAAIMAHEFGHLAHRDTDSLLIVVVGNMLMTVIMGIIGVICNIFGWIGDTLTENTTLGKILPFSLITRAISFLLTTVFMFLWTKLGALFCMKGNRNQEFQADRYAAELGYAQNLIDAFVELEAAPAPKGLWATLTSTHPDDADRIVKLNEYIEESQLH